MEDPAPDMGEPVRTSRFQLAPPRHFVLPAVLLLLSEEPGHGYSLEKDLRTFDFGRIDRPTVYRALAQLEKDGLVESWAEAPSAGHARRVYGITAHGERVLRTWMSVIKEERDCLGRVLRRYQATGTTDAMLAEVEGGWAAALGLGWSPVSATDAGPSPRRLAPVDSERTASDEQDDVIGAEVGDELQPADAAVPIHDTPGGPRRFRLLPDRSVVLIDVRSTVGPISFGAIGVTGTVEAEVVDGAVRVGTQPSAHIEIAVDGLRSGNGVYDAELLRRIDARRFPTASIDLEQCAVVGSGNRYRLDGALTFHGVSRRVQGAVTVTVESDKRLVVTGEQVFDIRDFAVPSPTVLMLRIYPDVRVHLHIEAEIDEE